MHLHLLADAVSPASPNLTSASLWLEGIGLLALLAFYGWLAARMSAHATLKTQPFGIADAICAGILAIWMITVIWQSLGVTQVITLPAILANSIVYGALVLGIFGVIGFRGESAISIFQLQPSRFPRAAGTGLLWLVITYPLILAAQFMVERVFGSADDSQLIVKYFLEHPDLKHRAAVIFMAVIVAPVAEEVLFRGYFYGVIRRYGGRLPALLTSSLLFAAIHVHLPSLLGLGILAVILCLLYERTGSLWAPITMHAAFNTTTIVMLILFPEALT
jgi:membrane protease YdiL (CAAX protease family)